MWVAVAEWLRRWTRNPMGFPRVGSNPARDVRFYSAKNKDEHKDFDFVNTHMFECLFDRKRYVFCAEFAPTLLCNALKHSPRLDGLVV